MPVCQIVDLLRRKVNFDYPSTVRFRCLKCGICCGDTEEKKRHILLFRKEAEQIAKATLQPIHMFAFELKDKAPYSYEIKRRVNDKKCVFFETNHCTIYSLRPLICRFYPFELKMSISQKYMFLFTKECPGINKGRMLGKGHFRKMFRLARAKYIQTEYSHRGG